MWYLEAPNEQPNWPLYPRSLFLAGGIMGCPDWQAETVRLLDNTPLLLLNPRRADFPMRDPSAAARQIRWEHMHLRLASAVLFWFCAETVQPIVLYELGAWSMTSKPLFIGVHPDYQRRQDVEIQTRLARPDLRIVNSIPDLVGSVKIWAGRK
jgi:nucleoside 2-deoxyribosyltransferase-like protein